MVFLKVFDQISNPIKLLNSYSAILLQGGAVFDALKAETSVALYDIVTLQVFEQMLS